MSYEPPVEPQTPPASPPPASPPPASVVIDDHATVPVKRWPIWVAIGAVLAFIAFTAGWYALNGDDDYEAGPVAQHFADDMDAEQADVTLSAAELKCIDHAGRDVDPEDLVPGALDPFSEEAPSEADEFAPVVAEIFDNCLDRDTRIELLVTSLLIDDPTVTEDQAHCVAEGFDELISEAGGWLLLLGQSDDEQFNPVFFALFNVMDECGVPLE